MCLAGRILGVVVLLVGGVLYRTATWSPDGGVWVVDFDLAADIPPSASSRFLSDRSELHGESDAPAAAENQTGFVVPQWKPRCDLNRTRFAPECLPEPIYDRKTVDDWTFAELCSVEYAAVKVANQGQKGSAHTKILALMYDNVVATIMHFVIGMAVTGIFLRRRMEKKDEKNSGPVSTMNTMLDYLYVVTTTVALLQAVGTGLLTIVKFWQQASEYFHGVWMLPPHAASYHCKSILLSEFLYYKNLLGYLTLASFTVMDLIVIGIPILTWLGLTTNFCCQCCVCAPLAKLCAALCSCLRYVFTCAWCPGFCSCLKYIFTCRWLCDCCALMRVCVVKLCHNLYWLVCQCGVCKGLKMCCVGLGHFFCFACWDCGFLCSHLSWLCCCNACCSIPLTLLGFVLVLALFLPLPVYLLLGMLAYSVSIAVTVSLLLVPVLTAFWLLTQAVTAVCLIKELVSKSENPPEFMTPREYYAVYADELLTQVKESYGDAVNILVAFKEKVAEKMKEAKEAHQALPDAVTEATVYMELSSKTNRIVNGFLPVCLVLTLLVGSAIMSGGTVSLMQMFGRHYDLKWQYCTKDGLPVACVAKSKFNLSSDLSDEDSIRHGDLITVAGVRVPKQWPTFKGIGFEDRCTCLECDGHAVVTGISNDTACAPAELPGEEEVPLACAGDSDAEPTEEREFGATGTPPFVPGCEFSGEPYTTYFWDRSCQEGDRCCKADGKNLECRYCDSGDTPNCDPCPTECNFWNPTATPYFWDPTCVYGMLGCFADGESVACRYCGVGKFAEIPCPTPAPTPAPTPEPTPEPTTERLLSIFANSLEQNESDVRRPDGSGHHGHVLEGRHRYMGGGRKVHPKILNTYKMKVDHPPRKGCYGALFTPLEGRLNGWCNCSSGEFVPTAVDIVYEAASLRVPPGKYYYYAPSPLRAEVLLTDYARVDGYTLVSARNWAHDPSEQGWVEDQKLESEEWVHTYGADPSIGLSVFAGTWTCWLQGWRASTELLKTIFVDTFWGRWVLLTKHFPRTCRWLAEEFYTLRNFVLALTAWFRTQDKEDFEECSKIVIFGRSMAAVMTGIAGAITRFNQAHPYSLMS